MSRRRRLLADMARRHPWCEAMEARLMLTTTVSLSVNTPIVVENGSPATFTFSRNTSTGTTTVHYIELGSAPASQFVESFPGTITIPAGQTSVATTATPVGTNVAGTPDRIMTLIVENPTDGSYTATNTNQATILVENAGSNLNTANSMDILVSPTSPGAGLTYYTNTAAALTHASAGQYIDVLSATYNEDVANVSLANLTIRGIGNGRAVMSWPYLGTNIAYIPNQKGIVDQKSTATNFTLENMEMDGARINSGGVGKGDDDGAGFRGEAAGCTITNCRFYNDEDGIDDTNGAGAVTITDSEFVHNGIDGETHNIYVSDTSITRLTFDYNYSHDAGVLDYSAYSASNGGGLGHLFKSRALVNVIEYNDFDDGTDTPSLGASYELSTPNGGQDTIVGNLIVQQANSQNSIIVDYGSETSPHAPLPGDFLYLANNTIVNNKGSGTFVQAANLPAGIDVTLRNNIFAGTGTEYSLSGTTTVTFNQGNVVTSVAGAKFVSASTGNYDLAAGSPAIGAGVALLPGDCNGDGAVTLDDLNIFASNFGQTTTLGWAVGDFTGSGSVDLDDLNLFAANFGQSLPYAQDPNGNSLYPVDEYDYPSGVIARAVIGHPDAGAFAYNAAADPTPDPNPDVIELVTPSATPAVASVATTAPVTTVGTPAVAAPATPAAVTKTPAPIWATASLHRSDNQFALVLRPGAYAVSHATTMASVNPLTAFVWELPAPSSAGSPLDGIFSTTAMFAPSKGLSDVRP